MQFRKVEIKKIILVVLSVIVMGFALSFLNRTNLGTDPCTTLNLGISSKLGLSLGNFQAMFNCLLLLIVFVCDKSQIGWGTIANMFLVGYSFDFFSQLNEMWISEKIYSSMSGRILVMLPSLVIFILAAAVYMAVQLGTAPYDALPFIISTGVPGIPFRLIRICWDLSACLLGFLLGSKPGIVTIIMAFALGPVTTWVKVHLMDKYLYRESSI